MIKDWNHQRRRTRDLLLLYNNSMPQIIHNQQILPTIYPWENSSFTTDKLEDKIYQVFYNNGFTETQESFYEKIIYLLQNT